MHQRTVVEPQRVRTFQRQQLRCGKCDHLINVELEVHVEISQFVRAMQALRCPDCGSKKILMGQNRSLAEDQAFPSTGDVSERASSWLENGEMGSSSEAIRLHMTGKPKQEMSAPADTADLRRCVLLLHRIPEWRERMSEMSVYGPWSRIAPQWAALESLFIEETGVGLERVSASRTGELLSSLRV